MKKLVFYLAFAFAGTFLWIACGSDNNAAQPAATTQETTTPAPAMDEKESARLDSLSKQMENSTKEVEENRKSLQKALNDL